MLKYFTIIFFLIQANAYIYTLNNLEYNSYKYFQSYCLNECITGNNFNDSIPVISTNQTYNFNDYQIVKLKLVNCDAINIDTNHYTSFSYSYDQDKWSEVNGFVKICPKIGDLYLNITGKFTIYQLSNKTDVYHYRTLIPGNSINLTYAGYGNSSFYMLSECDLNINIFLINSFDGISLSFPVDRYFGFYDSMNIYINYTVTINNPTSKECPFHMYWPIETKMYISNYTANVLFYNGINIANSKYLITNNDSVILDGYMSTIPRYVTLNQSESNISDIYSQIFNYLKDGEYLRLNDFQVEDNSNIVQSNNLSVSEINNLVQDKLRYFDDFVRNSQGVLWLNESINNFTIGNITIYSDGKYSILNKYPYNPDTIIVNSTNYVIIDQYNNEFYYVEPIPIYLDNYNNPDILVVQGTTFKLTDSNQSIIITNSSLLLDKEVTVKSLENQGTLNMFLYNNSKVIVTGCINISGDLNITLDESNNQTKIEVFEYECRNGTFENVNMYKDNQPIDNCPEYENNQLVIIIGSCDMKLSKELTIIFISVAIFVLIAVAVVIFIIFRVKSVRKNVFPYRDRKHWRPQQDTPQ